MTQIADGTVVSIHYTIRDEAGEVLSTTPEGEPVIYLQGANNIVPGLERELLGRTAGESVQAVVSPEDGYGPRSDRPPQAVDKKGFPEGMPLEPGIGFAVEGADGKPMPLWIDRVEGDKVFVDTNHPLAGKTLHFEVSVLTVRAATDEERAHGHPHGPTGAEGHA